MSEVPSTQARPTRGAWFQLGIIAFLVLAADQITKFLAVKHLTYAFQYGHAESFSQQLNVFLHRHHLMGETRGHYDVISAFWSHRYAENPGAAWSILATAPEKFRAIFFMVVSVVAIVLIAMYYAKLAANQKLLRLALALVMGGALGNLVDRMIRSYVIDFIDWHLNDPNWLTRWHWPTFNVADAGISVGVALIALDTVRSWWAMRRQSQSTASATTV
jgi:signal peptidase II